MKDDQKRTKYFVAVVYVGLISTITHRHHLHIYNNLHIIIICTSNHLHNKIICTTKSFAQLHFNIICLLTKSFTQPSYLAKKKINTTIYTSISSAQFSILPFLLINTNMSFYPSHKYQHVKRNGSALSTA